MSLLRVANGSHAARLLYRPASGPFNRLLAANFSTSNVVRRIDSKEIQTLEDLTKLESLKDVDPELIKRLIDERTSELNTKNELEMLKKFDREEQLLRQSPLKKFTRPFWIFLIMSSTVYLVCHYVWWRLEYEEKEIVYAKRVDELEAELNALLVQTNDEPGLGKKNPSNKSWFKRWFF